MKNKNINLIAIRGVDEIGASSMGFAFPKCKDILFIIDYGSNIEQPNYMNPFFASIPNIAPIIADYRKVVIIITHCHEDHIGGLQILAVLKEKDRKAYDLLCSRLTIYVATEFNKRVIVSKILNRESSKGKDLIRVNIEILGYEKSFIWSSGENSASFSFHRADHSIADSSFVRLVMNDMNIVHTGDWRINNFSDSLVDIQHSDTMNTIRELSKNEIDILVCESTRIETVMTKLHNERDVISNVNDIIMNHLKKENTRIILTMFSTNLERIIGILSFCVAKQIKVGYLGTSIRNMLTIAASTGMLDEATWKALQIVKIDAIFNRTNGISVFLCAGSQLEQNSTIHRIISTPAYYNALDEKNVFIFSSGVIPANSHNIESALSALAQRNCPIYHGHIDDIHLSGHASRNEIEYLYRSLQPKMLVVVHGDYIKTKLNEKLFRSIFPDRSVLSPTRFSLYNIEIQPLIGKISISKKPFNYNVNSFVKMNAHGFIEPTARLLAERISLINGGCICISKDASHFKIQTIGTTLDESLRKSLISALALFNREKLPAVAEKVRKIAETHLKHFDGYIHIV